MIDDAPAIAGRTLLVGLPDPELDRTTAARLERIGPAGVILFARNLESPEQTAALLAAVSRLLPHPLLLAVDQEGGRVSRLEPWLAGTPTAADLARAGAAATEGFARATAGALRALGFNLDFAPVVDLSEPAATNGIAERSFGTDPAKVSRLAAAYLDGLQGNGVAGCVKHFPGLGATTVDSHETLPTDDRPREELEAADLVPYRALAEKAATVMVGHGHYPGLGAAAGRPATLSPAIVGELLRGRLGYRGLVVSDDLEMGAVAALDVHGRAAVCALRAGCDLLLYCADLARAERARDALAADATADGGARLCEAAAAVERLALDWPVAPDPSAWERARLELDRSSSLA